MDVIAYWHVSNFLQLRVAMLDKLGLCMRVFGERFRRGENQQEV